MEPSVAFRCVATAHQVSEGQPDKLTVHDGQWAFCPFDTRAESHQWEPSGGLTLTMLQASALARAKEQLLRDRGGGAE